MIGRALDGIAAVLTYPNDGVHDRVTKAHEALAAVDEGLALHLDALVAAVESMPLTDLEELFTRTFEINPVCALEVGWHIWGEDYNRGVFLVKTRGILRELEIAETSELPDHLCSLLPAVARLPAEQAEELALEFMLPAMSKMIGGFRDDGNPFRGAVEAARALLVHVYGEPAEKTAVVPPGECQPYDFRNTPYPTANGGG